MKTTAIVFLVVIAAALTTSSLFAGPAKKKAPAAKKTGEKEKEEEKPSKSGKQQGCTTPACHKKVFAGKIVHGAVEAGKCTACHQPKAGKAEPKGAHGPGAFKLIVQGDQPCVGCHSDLGKSMAGGKVHAPVKKFGCIKCHTPHSSNTKGLLRTKTVAEGCFSCHPKVKAQPPFVHGPMAAGACTFCHSPHASKENKLLVATGKKLCLRCHEAERFQTKFKHKAVERGCESCHNAHGSDQKFFVRKKLTELCGGCHEKIVKRASSAKHQHPPVVKGNCAGCHDPHGSAVPHLLKGHAIKVCTSCHTKLLTGSNKHGPVQEGDCGACHQPHGGENVRMLFKPFPADFYGPFSEKRYALCFECHEANILRDRTTTTLTQFRNGNKNLHYVHVVSPGNNSQKGRSCKACHEVHAGPQAKHIREKVPFGSSGWLLPIEYTKLKDGGKCVVGCHVPRSYQR